MNNNDMKDYIASLLNKDLREDGRKLLEYRKPIKIELNISKNAEGSARVIMGETEVIAGVKMNVGEPFPDTPEDGILITGAELLALSSPEFELGPPDAQTTEVARIIDRGVRESGMIDLKKLCIKRGELVWIIFLDLYTINDQGNLIDAGALASVAALLNTVLPKLKDNKVLFGEHTKEKLPVVNSNIPVTCTIIKIGDKFVVDPTAKEEKVSDSRFTIAISEKEHIHALQKGGSKGVTEQDIDKMIDIASSKAKELRKVLPGK